MTGEGPPHVESSTTTTMSSWELQRYIPIMTLPNMELKKGNMLTKQASMCETPRDIAWERRRKRRIHQKQEQRILHDYSGHLTNEDWNELKGCIELGFGFNEEDGQTLCNTLPALDLYFAVNRNLSPSPVSTPHSGGSASSFGSPTTPDSDSWKICTPGDDPEHVKTKLRHWVQAVTCSVMQSH
ncbi:hypothetical protein TanjilG_24964 [Lupinus angustifolius]|uniref:Uncharacterized protein n=1 Tax=Lupinus angustifolius TaxID=3871 RepID=A0A394DBZ5_LUPAN|nr:PREDICTED: uncharacterized protein LOC109338992 [Lupinus angustifolius]OIW20886.1 hypothetical protein TanjilG_24964 [Lupinus angustifolius]